MCALYSPPTLIPALAASHGSHPHRLQQRPLHLGTTRSALGSLTQLIRAPAVTLGNLLDGALSASSVDPNALPDEVETAKSIFRLQLHSATSLEEWRTAAVRLDELEGNNVWKSEHVSSEYNYQLIQSRLAQLEHARTSCDADRMLFLVRTSLTRHLGGMGNTLLYSHSRIGTKHLIEQYISSALITLSSLLDITHRQRGSGLDLRELLQQVLKARQSYGRSALLLSGGGTFGMNHIGVVKCLWENSLLPRIISGASAGSIVCAVLCTRTDDEIPAMLQDFCHGDLEVFTRTGVDDGVLRQVGRFLKSGALFDIANLTRVMKEMLGDLTFQEAYNRTRRILNICVSSASLFELPRLLNYVTAPNVLIWSAVAASCSVPLIYSPAGLLAKDPKTLKAVPWNPTPQRWIDGSVENDLPMTRLAEMFNVNHFIVSQVNPHVVPFLAEEEGMFAAESSANHSAVDTGPGWLNVLANMAKDEAMHRMHVLSELGIMSTVLTKTRSVLSQRYSGDITIFPEISYSQFPKVLRNPTEDFMLQATLHGERATWPKLSRIQNHCAIELALDDAVQQLRARIAFSPSQVDLRLNAIGRPVSRAGSESSKLKSGSSNRKTLRSTTSGITKARRSISSSNSDSRRPSFPPTPLVSPPQPPMTRKVPASFHLELDPAVAVYDSETREDSSASSQSEYASGSEDDEERLFSVRSAGYVETGAPEPLTLLTQLHRHKSQPALPAVTTGSYSGFSDLGISPTTILPMTPARPPDLADERDESCEREAPRAGHVTPTTHVPAVNMVARSTNAV